VVTILDIEPLSSRLSLKEFNTFGAVGKIAADFAETPQVEAVTAVPMRQFLLLFKSLVINF
jgi:hypothetical protein